MSAIVSENGSAIHINIVLSRFQMFRIKTFIKTSYVMHTTILTWKQLMAC